jgi:hypothetical protein
MGFWDLRGEIWITKLENPEFLDYLESSAKWLILCNNLSFFLLKMMQRSRSYKTICTFLFSQYLTQLFHWHQNNNYFYLTPKSNHESANPNGRKRPHHKIIAGSNQHGNEIITESWRLWDWRIRAQNYILEFINMRTILYDRVFETLVMLLL